MVTPTPLISMHRRLPRSSSLKRLEERGNQPPKALPSSSLPSMRKLCPNFDREDGLETVLEVPIPEEMFTSMGSNNALRWQNLRIWMSAQGPDKSSSPSEAGRNAELQLLLNVVGSPLIPLPVPSDQAFNRPIKNASIVRNFIFSFDLIDE